MHLDNQLGFTLPATISLPTTGHMPIDRLVYPNLNKIDHFSPRRQASYLKAKSSILPHSLPPERSGHLGVRAMLHWIFGGGRRLECNAQLLPSLSWPFKARPERGDYTMQVIISLRPGNWVTKSS